MCYLSKNKIGEVHRCHFKELCIKCKHSYDVFTWSELGKVFIYSESALNVYEIMLRCCVIYSFVTFIL